MPILKCLGCKYYDSCLLDHPLKPIILSEDVSIKCEQLHDLRKFFVNYIFSDDDNDIRSGKFYKDYVEVKK